MELKRERKNEERRTALREEERARLGGEKEREKERYFLRASIPR